jgi:hypothetical protein
MQGGFNEKSITSPAHPTRRSERRSDSLINKRHGAMMGLWKRKAKASKAAAEEAAAAVVREAVEREAVGNDEFSLDGCKFLFIARHLGSGSQMTGSSEAPTVDVLGNIIPPKFVDEPVGGGGGVGASSPGNKSGQTALLADLAEGAAAAGGGAAGAAGAAAAAAAAAAGGAGPAGGAAAGPGAGPGAGPAGGRGGGRIQLPPVEGPGGHKAFKREQWLEEHDAKVLTLTQQVVEMEKRAQGTERALLQQMGDLQSTVAGLENKMAMQMQAQFDTQLEVITRLLAGR